MLFNGKAQDTFKVENIISSKMETFVSKCANAYEGKPDWVNTQDGSTTSNAAKTSCQEVARLTILAAEITRDGSARAEWLQKQIDNIYFQLRTWVEYGTAYGTIILKPNGEDVDCVFPDRFIVTSEKNGKIVGAVFITQKRAEDGKKWYTRMEYHRFEDKTYIITNKAYDGSTEGDTTKEVSLEATPWNGLEEEVSIEGLEKPLFAVLRMPSANNIDHDSPLGLPIFAGALEELKDLDVAYSRKAEEVLDSQRVVLLDSDKLLPSKGSSINTVTMESTRKRMKLPKFVRNVMGNGASDFYQEINPTLQTPVRQGDIDSLLSQIGYKCGFSNGYFVFNQKTGMVTATQVESDDRRTIQTIKDVRDQLESCLDDLIYTLDNFATLYDYAPVGTYEVNYSLGDITYNEDEDRARWLTYVERGYVPAWKYFVKFEGMTEEEAKAVIEEAQNAALELQQKQTQQQSLFMAE